jgi:hypothetical protein
MTITWQPIGPAEHAAESSAGILVHQEGEKFSSLNVSTYFLDVKTIVDLGFGSIASYQNETNVTFYMLEVACYTGIVLATVQRHDSNDVQLQRMGVGFRIGVASFGTKNKASLTLAEVAANAQLNLTSTKVQVQILGADLNAIPLLAPIQGMVTFQADSLKIIGKAGVDLAEYFVKNQSTVKPVGMQVAPLHVVSNPEMLYYNSTYSGQFAAQKISMGRSWREGMDEIANGQDIHVVPSFAQAVYTVLGLVDDYAKPTDAAKENATILLELGRFKGW